MIKKEIRQQKIRLRKNFLPTLVITIFLWGSVGTIIYFTDPETPGVMIIFFLVVFLVVLFSSSTIFSNSRRGLIAAVVLTVFLILRYLGVGSILNFILLVGIGTAFELYLLKK